MIPKSKGLIYSYKDFSDKDLELSDTSLDFDESTDTISFLDLTVDEFIDFIRKNFVKYCKDVNCDGSYRGKYFFKEFCIRFNFDSELEHQRIYHYSMSDWNIYAKKKGIDDRTLTIKTYNYYNRVDSSYIQNQIIIKTEHIYQLIKDLGTASDCIYNRTNQFKAVDWIVDDDIVNLYVLPIYINENDKYIRISDYCYNTMDCEQTMQLLDDIRDAIKIFACTNFYMLDMYNSNDRVSVYNERTRRFSNLTFKAYSTVATNDKKVYAYLENKNPSNYTPSVEISINTDRENILAGTDTPRKICDYRFTVRGHKSHRWVGKRGDQHLAEVWIDPYEKNKDKPYKIIKETKIKE